VRKSRHAGVLHPTTEGRIVTRRTRTKLALSGALTLALAATIGAGAAQGAKVTESAPGGLLPDEVIGPGGVEIQTPLVQEFKLKGKNVKGKQILDVNVTVNSTSADLNANTNVDAVLVGPKRNNEGLNLPDEGNNMVNVKLDDQSDLFDCNPFEFQRRDCNYLQGGNVAGSTGTMTGSLSDFLNPVFKGGNPKGTWTLYVFDTNDGVPAITWGTTTLEVKTGKKFAKE
jgi:hypothetical protein